MPQKNILPVGGKPLIAWTVEAAFASRYSGRVIVSTDDDEIAEVCRSLGAEVPFMRPAALAEDTSSHADVVRHALEFVREEMDELPEFCLLLQPTSPFRTAGDIERIIKFAEENGAERVVSVCPTTAHPYLMRRITDTGKLERFVDTPESYLRTQDMPPAFRINGALYLFRSDLFLETGKIIDDETFAFVMDEAHSLDVDTPWDLHLADLLLSGRE